jgi:hypothetical protein
MAIAKVIKGATRMVTKTVCVEEKQPDTVVLELSQDEANVLRFIVGMRYGDDATTSTQDIYAALRDKATKKLEKDYQIVGDLDGWKIVPKVERNC